MYFQISLSLWELHVIKDLLCIRDIAEKSLNRLLPLLFIKNSKFHRKKLVLESLFNKVTGLRAHNFLKKGLQHKYFSSEICEIFTSTYFEEYLWTSASPSSGKFYFQNMKKISSMRRNWDLLKYIWRSLFVNSKHLLALNCFHQKVPSEIFGMVPQT